jgi:hypothetical protein
MWYEPSRLGLLSFIHGCCSTGGPGQAGAEPHRWTRKCVEVKGLVDYSSRTEPTAQCMRKRKDHQTRLTDNDVGARHCIDPPLHFDPGHRQVLPPPRYEILAGHAESHVLCQLSQLDAGRSTRRAEIFCRPYQHLISDGETDCPGLSSPIPSWPRSSVQKNNRILHATYYCNVYSTCVRAVSKYLVAPHSLQEPGLLTLAMPQLPRVPLNSAVVARGRNCHAQSHRRG